MTDVATMPEQFLNALDPESAQREIAERQAERAQVLFLDMLLKEREKRAVQQPFVAGRN